VEAPGLGLSVIPAVQTDGSKGEDAFLWGGERWLSGSGNPAKCPALCMAGTGDCAQPEGYHKGHDFACWYPLGS
jgi:hypothetical protein